MLLFFSALVKFCGFRWTAFSPAGLALGTLSFEVRTHTWIAKKFGENIFIKKQFTYPCHGLQKSTSVLRSLCVKNSFCVAFAYFKPFSFKNHLNAPFSL